MQQQQLNNITLLLKKTPAIAGVFKLQLNNYLTVVVALRFHFHAFSPEPWTNGRTLP